MPSITSVAAIGHRLTTLPQFESAADDSPFPLHVLLILVGRGIAADSIDNHVNTFVLRHLIDEPDVVLLRVHPTQADRVKTTLEQSVGLRDRFEGRAVGVLTLTAELEWEIRWIAGIAPKDSTPAVSVADETLITQARAAELGTYAERPGVVLPHSESFHYEGPNGSHYASYFRGAFAFTSRDAIDGLAFWMVNRIPRGSTVLLDSPGFLGVGLGVADYFRRELLCEPHEIPSVEARDFYGEDPGLIATRLQLDARVERPVVILSSVVSSGRSLDAMQQACVNAGFNDVRPVLLFGATGTASGEEPPLHFLSIDLSRDAADACIACTSERKPVVRIRRSTGLVEVSALVSKARVTLGSGRQASDFFSRNANVPGVVSVHRDQHDSRRHHVIDISLRALTGVAAFAERVEAVLAPHRGRSVVVLHPEHEDAAALAALVTERLPAERSIPCDPASLGELSADETAALKSASVILLVDDVAITGSRLRQYRAFLNMYGIVSPGGDPEVGAFVGVLRAASSDRRESIMDMADRPTRLLFAEDLMLPDWREADCPWCLELRLLEASRVAVGSLMAERRDRLRQGGLTTGLFLPFSTTENPGTEGDLLGLDNVPHEPVDAMDLGPRSVFGDLRDESQTFVAIASALQVMRDNEGRGDENALSETFTSPISRVLAPEYYLSGRFYAPVVLCSILRAARRFDIRAAAIEPSLRQAAGERYADLPALRAEMLYAMARGILPRPTEVADQAALAAMDSSVRAFLRSASRRFST